MVRYMAQAHTACAPDRYNPAVPHRLNRVPRHRTLVPRSPGRPSCQRAFSVPSRSSKINEPATPKLEAHEREYRVARIDGTAAVKFNQAAHGERIEKPATQQHRAVERVIHF